jgi:hypothetical protein
MRKLLIALALIATPAHAGSTFDTVGYKVSECYSRGGEVVDIIHRRVGTRYVTIVQCKLPSGIVVGM